jgi:1-acyl-sn-glycerol-3-phosphate acyltransferase
VSPLPHLGAAIPRRGSRFFRVVGRAILALIGWRVEGEVPNVPKMVIGVAPHTSNWDFIVGVAVMFALDLRIDFLGKHTLFRGPLGAFMRWIGGIPVDRSHPQGVVPEAVAGFGRVQQRLLAIAPQGTRTRGARFKSGFLRIARGAGVPVVLAALDYGARAVRFGPTFMPGEDIDAELARTEAYFAPIQGKRAR